MAESQGPQLKYLGFFRVAVIRSVAYLTNIYDHLKDKSGFLKPGLVNVEGTVKTVVGPVYQKLESKPDELLSFVDEKVDAILKFITSHTPGYVKDKSAQAYDLAKAAPENAKAVYGQVQEKGVVGVSKAYYSKYEPVVQDYAYSTWKWGLSFPYVPQIVNALTPPALYGAGKYNYLVSNLKESQVPLAKPVAAYLPTVPVEKVEKTVKADTADALKKS
eukprot:jgi/Mesen1/709/ME000109S_10929